MSNIETGGPAFPLVAEAHEHVISTGMTLRDYFAAKALQGGLAHNRPAADAEGWAKWAYKMADAMLKARSQS
jgi:hypothetical protein